MGGQRFTTSELFKMTKDPSYRSYAEKELAKREKNYLIKRKTKTSPYALRSLSGRLI
jgi:hypothetical protein